MTLLDPDQIRAPLTARPRKQLERLDVFDEIESTNSYLLSEAAPAAGRFRVALAEHQTAGRGRMNKRWVSPAASGVCMSMAYTFGLARADLSAVTLAVGVGVAQVIESAGLRGVQLKWPNDLVVKGSKLGGILTEVRHGAGTTVVVGIGINVDLGAGGTSMERLPTVGAITDLVSHGVVPPSRSHLSSRLIERLFDTLTDFEASGFVPFAEEYARLDWLHGRNVVVDGPSASLSGVADGVDLDGSLILSRNGDRQRIVSGSVRIAAEGAQT